VRLVWDSSGLIGNGGFHRFFEGDYPGDPGFVYTVAAYKRIGAEAAYEALKAAFRQFPDGVLPTDIGERLRIFDSLPEQTWEEIEARYYRADKELERLLAMFIREHRSGYERLLAGRGTEPAAPSDARA
jgi:thymidylate kinase